MSKKFKKHTFIPWEKIAKKLGIDEKLHLYLYETEQSAKEKKTTGIALKFDQVKTGYCQYALTGYEDYYYDFVYENPHYNSEDVTSNPRIYLNINKKLKEAIALFNKQSFNNVKVKPVFKLYDKNTGIPVEYDAECLSGTYQAEFIGLLIKG